MTGPLRSRVRAHSTSPRSHLAPSHRKRPPPRSLSSPPRTLDCLTLTCPMLPSVNRKYGYHNGGQRFYIKSAYRSKEEALLELLTLQLVAINAMRHREARSLWIPQATDRYVILYDFEFVDELRQDVHNPLKPMCDLLQKAGIIYNDNRVIQESQQKRVALNREDPHAIITIYKMPVQQMLRVPFQQMLEEFFQQQPQQYTIERYTLPDDNNPTTPFNSDHH